MENLTVEKTVYAPLLEQDSILLSVSEGCSYGKCAFCDFANDQYTVFPLEWVKENAKYLAAQSGDKSSVFLLGQNSLSLPTAHILKVLEYVKAYFPKVERVGMYARAEDINAKSEREMSMLRDFGLRTLHIGLESGSDDVLTLMNKGISASEFLEACHKLDSLALSYHLTTIGGLGGKELSAVHVEKTAEILNRTYPASIWQLKLFIWPNTPLADMRARGDFIELSPMEVLIEERELLARLHLNNCFFMDTTVLNQYTIMGHLPDAKSSMIAAMDRLIAGDSP
ncbi:MAG: radical SAM protein [Saccharofermentanales bacterium]